MNSQMILEEVVPKAQHIVTKEDFLKKSHINYLSCRLVRDEENSYITRKITSPDDVRDMAIHLLGLDSKDTEEFWVLHISTRSILSGLSLISKGSLNETICHPREVFKAAILNNSASIILMHNHPSGEADPSGNDKATTERLVEAGKIIGIRVLDHVVIGNDSMFSFKENALI